MEKQFWKITMVLGLLCGFIGVILNGHASSAAVEAIITGGVVLCFLASVLWSLFGHIQKK